MGELGPQSGRSWHCWSPAPRLSTGMAPEYCHPLRFSMRLGTTSRQISAGVLAPFPVEATLCSLELSRPKARA